MEHSLLQPHQILTLQDYPLFNEHILKIYFRIFVHKQGKLLPPCPVIHKSLGAPFMKEVDSKTKKYNIFLQQYLNDHPTVEYFLLDGSHKTTAATLSNEPIPVVILKSDKDFIEAKKLTETGEFFGWYSIESSIQEALLVLAKHHFGTREFLTVEEKTLLLVTKKDLPSYIIQYFKKQVRYPSKSKT